MSFKLKDFLKKVFPDKKEFDDMPDEIVIASGQPVTPAAAPPKDDSNNTLLQAVEALKAENKKLSDNLASLLAKDENREKLLAQRAQEENRLKIEAAIKKAVDEKRIEAQNKALQDSYKALLEKDYDNGIKTIEALPAIGVSEKPKAPETPITKTLENGGSILNHIKEHQKSTALGEIK